jgi:5-methylcytosine-specific restriction endonuclease McrA
MPQTEKQRLWYQANKERLKAKARAWNANNKDRKAEAGKKYYQDNLEKSKRDASDWKKANPHKVNATNSKRRAMMQHGCSQMPDSERAEVEYLYWLARDLTAVSGEQYHVDHIKPLSKGGEHRLDNLQILHAEDNLKKGAKHDQSA